jgi:catechol 2,3-dioxygenase-like lactoylglutathione lyase family enzyme
LSAKRDEKIQAHGGWIVSGFKPIFTVADVARSTDHYAKMGFEISFHDETYAFAHHERDLTIHLARRENDDQERAGSLYIHCKDADELADGWRKAGLEVTGPKDEEFGKREGSHIDPDGNLIRFGSPLR